MPSRDQEQTRWFTAQLQPHEAALRGWLRGQYPSLPDVDDIVQEAYARVLRMWDSDRAKIASPKAVLFAVARNLALDLIRHRQIVGFDELTETQGSHVLEDVPGISEAVSRRQELELLTEAIQSLPERCRQVLTLRKIYGLSQKEIAAQLGISEHTVEAQVGNGVRRCAEYLARLGLP